MFSVTFLTLTRIPCIDELVKVNPMKHNKGLDHAQAICGNCKYIIENLATESVSSKNKIEHTSCFDKSTPNLNECTPMPDSTAKKFFRSSSIA